MFSENAYLWCIILNIRTIYDEKQIQKHGFGCNARSLYFFCFLCAILYPCS